MKIQSKEHILYVITKSNWGGAQRYVFDKATEDKNNNINVTVALGGNGELKQKLEQENTPTIQIPNLQRDISIFKEFKVYRSLKKIYKETQPTKIHLNSSKIGGVGSLAGRMHNMLNKNKAEIIYTAHGWVFNEDRNFIQTNIIKLLTYLTLLFSHRVITLSKFEYNQVSRWPGIKNKLEIKPLEIKNIEFIPRENSRDYFAKNLGINHTKKWLVTIAELHKNKGLEYGIEAIKNIEEDIVWIIIGEGEERVKLEKLIDKYNLKDKVILNGYLKNASKYLKAFDIFLLPSIKEGLPYVLLEAEKAYLPIIATKVGGIQEYFDRNGNIIINPKKPIEIAKAVEEMI